MSSSSSSQQYLMCNTDSSNSSSSALSSPYLHDPRQHPSNSGSLPRPPRIDRDVFAYPERVPGHHPPVARNHSCDELGDRNVAKVAVEEYPKTTDSLKMRTCRGVVDGYDSRSIRGLSKRYSYKMALESSDADDVRDEDHHHYDFVEGDDDDDEEDNLYSVSNTRTAHILTRSSSTHHTAHHCQHHVQQSSVDPHLRRRHHQHGPAQNKDHVHQHHHHHHQHEQYMQQTQQQLHHHHHHHQQHPPSMSNSTPQAVAASKDISRHHHHQGHSRKPSDSTPRAQTSKPPLHKSEKQGTSQRKAELQEPRFNYLPVDKSPSVTSTGSSHMKSSKSSSGAFLRTCAGFENMKISNDFASCFKGQRKNSELLDEIAGPSTPGSSDRMKTFCTPPQRSLFGPVASTMLPNDHSEDRLALMAATSADVSFMQSIESFEVDNDSLSNGLFLDNSDWAYGSCLQDLVHDRSFVRNLCMSQQLRMEDFQKCMDHLNQKRTRLKLLTPLHMMESQDHRRDGNLPPSRHHHQSLEPRVHRTCNHPCQLHHPSSASNQIHHNQSSASRNVNQPPIPNSSQSQRGHEHSGRPRTASCSVLGKDI